MWQPSNSISSELDALLKSYRVYADNYLRLLMAKYCPGFLESSKAAEYRKLVELSTKMQLVGHACAEVAGFPFDPRRQRISTLFGACCYVGDSFLDDFGEAASREYVERFRVFLTQGWFDIKNDLEQVFYIVVCRLFLERDILQPMLRQSLLSLFTVQSLDVELSLQPAQKRNLHTLKNCGRDRSGHAITVLALFLAPSLSLPKHHALYNTGSLISYIDDYGDYYFDRAQRKATYMNSVRHPAGFLKQAFCQTFSMLDNKLEDSHGRDLLKAFLHRYYTSRLRKHQEEREKEEVSLPVYE